MWFSVAGFRFPIFGFREHVLLYGCKLLITLDLVGDQLLLCHEKALLHNNLRVLFNKHYDYDYLYQ